MEAKVVRKWIEESTVLLMLMYAGCLIFMIVYFVTKLFINADFLIIIVPIYPIFSALLNGRKFRNHSMFGFSRKQYLKNLIMLHFVLATEIAIINTVMIESILRWYPNNTIVNFRIESFMGATVFDKILYSFLYFLLIYSVMFFDEVRNKPLRLTDTSIKSLSKIFILIFIVIYINLIFQLLIPWDNLFLKLAIYFGFLIAIMLIYFIGYKKMLKKELVWVNNALPK